MLDLSKSAFQKMHQRYCKILNNYYPAHNSNGFTERNLTNNFVYALEGVTGENTYRGFRLA
jgi:cysteine sulfinate desulfinase/cysteine desulfurase-like protein